MIELIKQLRDPFNGAVFCIYILAMLTCIEWVFAP